MATQETSYVIRHRDGSYWAGTNRWIGWIGSELQARRFTSWAEAELAGLQHIRISAREWSVERVSYQPQKAAI